MDSLTKAEILEFKNLEIVAVSLPEMGKGKVINIIAWNGRQRDRWEQQLQDNQKGKKISLRGIKALACCLSICNDKGEMLFNENDSAELNKISAKIINKLWDKICEINGIGESEVEELQGNSKGGAKDGFGSASQENLESL